MFFNSKLSLSMSLQPTLSGSSNALPTDITSITCSICKKKFKSKRSLSLHHAIIQKYNKGNQLKTLPKHSILEFKEILVCESNEIDSLIELANQNKSIKKKKSKFQCGEILVEWKQKKIKK
ncbi:21511_t:CDS:2, partial [Cetraspora pellucida]